MAKPEEHRGPIAEKEGERKIPVFTVLKNNAILKNIFLIDNPPLAKESEKKLEEILVVGRHPNCNITLEHPSISRFHLRIYSNSSSQSISVVDLSSVHGTWISGKRIESGVRIDLEEGDTMQLGGSSRVYRLHWIPLSRAYDLENPFVPPNLLPDPVNEGSQIDPGLSHEHDEMLIKNDRLENLDYTDVPSVESWNPSSPYLSEDNSPATSGDRMENDADTDILSLSEFFNEPTGGQLESTGSLKNLDEFDLKTGSTKESSLLKGDEVGQIVVWDEERLKNNADTDIQSLSKDSFLSGGGDIDEKMLTPEKENRPSSSLPVGSLKNTYEFDLINGSTTNTSALIVDEVDDEIVTPGQKKVTMNSHFLKSADEFDLSNGSTTKASVLKVDEVDDKRVTPDQEKVTMNVHFLSGGDADNEMFTPDKFDLRNGSRTRSSLLELDQVDDKIVTPDQEKVTMNICFLSGDGADNEMCTPDKQMLSTSKEKQSPSSLPLRSLSDMESGSTLKSSVDQVDYNIVGEYHLSCGHVDEEERFNPDKENLTCSYFSVRSLENADEFDLKSGSTKKSSLLNVDEEKVNPIKESVTLDTHILSGDMMDDEVDLKIQSTMKLSTLNMDGGDEEIVTPIKANETLNTHLQRLIKQKGKHQSLTKLEGLKPSPLKNTLHHPIFHEDEGVPCSLENENCDESDETFTPNKENMTPNTHFLWSLNKTRNSRETKNHYGIANEDDSLCSENKIGKLEETCNLRVLKPLFLQQCSMLPEKENHEDVLQEQISVCACNRNDVTLHQYEGTPVEKENHTEKVLQERMGVVNSSSVTESSYSTQDLSTKSIHHIKSPGAGKIYRYSEPKVRDENKSWCIVVDTTTLLNKESRKALQLLEGLKWTSLMIPRIVIRELGCMKKRRASFFRRTTEVSSALEWVENCMKNTKWWIHVQSSDEEEEEEEASTISQTAEDYIVEYALSLRKINNNKKLILLSDDVSLKIKSMAEGLLCERAAGFRESLVSPFSERFLWTESSPRGRTWSYLDDIVLKEPGNYPRGLKLILPHDSQHRQFTSSNKILAYILLLLQ